MVDAVVFRGHPGVGPVVEGAALVSPESFSARYDLNRREGVFSRITHPLRGQSLVDKIVLFPTAKGGVATAWAMLDMKTRGVAPKGLIFGRTNPIMVQGAVLAGLSLMDQLEPNPLEVVQAGDWLRLDPAAGTVEIVRRAADR